MGAAGVKAGETAAQAGQGRAAYTLKRLGTRRTRKSGRAVAVAAAVALLAAGGAVASYNQLGGHAGRPGPAPSRGPSQPGAAPASSSPAVAAPPAQARRTPSAAPTPSSIAPGHGPVASLEVAGVGCPSDGDEAVSLHNAPTGPGWMPAGGGWTGNGCSGITLWTMDPNGHQPVPSTFTWTFGLAAGTRRCTLSVFVPMQNSLGVGDYSVSVGPAATSQVVAATSVSQAAQAGHWITLGTFAVSGPSLEITTAPLPGASGPGHHGAIAASAASASCD